VSIINFTVNYDLFASDTDSSDSGIDADIVPLIGDVVFRPLLADDRAIQAPTYSPRPTGFKIREFTGYLDSDGRLKAARSGTTGVRLWANDPVLQLSTGLTYRVDFYLRSPIGDRVNVDGGYFSAPSTDTTINLADVLTSTGSVIVGSGGVGDGVYAREILDATTIGQALITAASASAARTALGAESTANRGVANGYASLDSVGKVPVSQLPNAIMEYQGVWNASTNTPTLADGTGGAGDVYRVTVAGNRNLGSGSIDFQVGDYCIYDGAVWQKADTTDAVATVAGRTGNVTLTFADIGGTAGIAAGGTGQTTAAAAITALTGTQTAGRYLRSDGTSASLSAIQAADVPTLNQSTTGNAATATNLVASTSSDVQLGTIQIGHASDTSVSRSAAGVLAVEGFDVTTTSVVSVTGTSTLSAVGARVYVVLLGSGAVPTLPTAVGNTSIYHLKNVHTAPISVALTSSQTIDGGTGSLTILPKQSFSIVSDNSNWWII